MKPSNCEIISQVRVAEDGKDPVSEKESAPLLVSSPKPVEVPLPELPSKTTSNHWVGTSG